MKRKEKMLSDANMIQCGDLWGGGCHEVLLDADRFRCKIDSHTSSRHAIVIRDALRVGFEPDELVVLQRIESDDDLSTELCDFLSTSLEGRFLLARHRCCPPEVMRKIVDFKELKVLRAASTNLCAPADVLVTLSSHSDYGVRANVAENTSCPRDAHASLAGDRSVTVRAAVASNTVVDPAILISLMHDDSDPVRLALVKNPISPPAVLESLISGKSHEIRIRAATHPNLHRSLALKLSRDVDWRVRGALGASITAVIDGSLEIFRALACDRDVPVRSKVAANSCLPEDLALELCQDPDYSVRHHLAANSALSVATYARLRFDERASVRRNLVNNPSRPLFYSDEEVEKFMDSNPDFAWLVFWGDHRLTPINARRAVDLSIGKSLPYDDFFFIHEENRVLLGELFLAGKIKFDKRESLSLLHSICQIEDQIELSKNIYSVIAARGEFDTLHGAKEVLRASYGQDQLRDFKVSGLH
ncbi:hypothetical protein [Acidithrix ferrooxidans]|uniref:Leucine rich repeat variant n=1 Tax=Acidithrix ferrooxidans TaxID=1280514 RepID=A0A0D8HFU4_9ACTN|nr:hypothetical protein [Acidithrix ferrooxidans]KJF16798.1 leucine rich repeat variant [Acidithrix ferrooxidans]